MAVVVKPATIDEYAEWMSSAFGVSWRAHLTQYERVAASVKRQFRDSGYWQSVLTSLPSLASEYYVGTGFLMTTSGPPEIIEKSWSSFWLKTYRRNVLDNRRWPRPPVGGWLLPETWHSQVSDMVRTRVIVRYLDAVEAVVDLLATVAREHRARCDVSYEATNEGYYAAHVGVSRRYEVPRATFGTERIRGAVEIQVTTQVKDVLQELLHKQYEARRLSESRPNDPWQWEYASHEFRSRYLGHLAHHMEGLIMDLRDEEEV